MRTQKLGIVVTSLLISALFWTEAWSNPTEAQLLTKQQAIRIAEETAKGEGYDLSKYNMTGCHYEYTAKDQSWTVFFVVKPPPPGGHFGVIIDARTGKARLMRGE